MAGLTMKMLARRLKALHRDERGADMVEYILIVAAIGLPLLGFIIYFWKDVKQWALTLYRRIQGEAEEGMQGG